METSGYYFEMAPNPDSQVTLANTTDPVFDHWPTVGELLINNGDDCDGIVDNGFNIGGADQGWPARRPDLRPRAGALPRRQAVRR